MKRKVRFNMLIPHYYFFMLFYIVRLSIHWSHIVAAPFNQAYTNTHT